jgi:hypothetical protein
MVKQISFDATKTEHVAVRKIIDRAEALEVVSDRMSSTMDIIACNANGTPLDFERFLAANDFNFLHDFCGIARHMNRETGKIEGGFLPRFRRQHQSTVA